MHCIFSDKRYKFFGHFRAQVSSSYTRIEEESFTTNDQTVISILKKTPKLKTKKMSTMNITNSIKGLVSKRRNRYKQDGFNLDLTCILF